MCSSTRGRTSWRCHCLQARRTSSTLPSPAPSNRELNSGDVAGSADGGGHSYPPSALGPTDMLLHHAGIDVDQLSHAPFCVNGSRTSVRRWFTGLLIRTRESSRQESAYDRQCPGAPLQAGPLEEEICPLRCCTDYWTLRSLDPLTLQQRRGPIEGVCQLMLL